MMAPMPMPALAPVVSPDGDGWMEGVDDGGCGRDVARSVDAVLLLLEGDEVVDKVDGGWDVNVVSEIRPTAEFTREVDWVILLGVAG